MPETVTIDRESLLDLLVEVQAVAELLEYLSGTGPTRLTEQLLETAGRVQDAVFGYTPETRDFADPGVERLLSEGEKRAREIMAKLGPPIAV